MRGSRESLALKMLRRLAHAVYAYPRVFFYSQILLMVFSVYYTVTHLEFNTSRNDLVGPDKKYHQNFLRFKKEFPGQDDLVAVVESESTEKNRQFVERLGARLEAETNLFTDVFFKGDLKMMGRKALLFLDEPTLVDLHKTLRNYRPFIQNFTAATNLNSLFTLVNRQFRTASREDNAENQSLIKAIPALERIVRGAEDCLGRPGTPPSPGISALFGGGEEAEREMYVTFAQGRMYLVSAQAVAEDLNEKAVQRFRELVNQTQSEVPGVNAGITGEPVLEIDEMAQSQVDTTIATIVSFFLVAVIFIYGYNETGRPIKATLCLVLGLGFTMAYATLVVGHLNILTITFFPMLIGLAIDFGVHLVTRYEEELRHGHTKRNAIEKAMTYTGLGIFTGCFTTAGAFLAMGVTNFRGIQEMGIISGGGLLICLVPMMTFLPVLLLRGHQNVIDHVHPPHEDARARLERIWLQRPYWVIGITLVLCAASYYQSRKVFFDYNLLNMQSQGLPAVQLETKLVNSASNSVLFGAVVADTLDQANSLEEKFKKLSTVSNVRSMSGYLTGDPTAKLRTIKEIKAEIASIAFAPMDSEPVVINDLDQTLWAFQGYLGLAMDEVGKTDDKDLAATLKSLRDSVLQLRLKMKSNETEKASEKLGVYQQAFFNDIHATFEALRTQDDSGPLTANDLSPAIRNRFIGRTGKYLLQVYPKGDVWERKQQEAFVKELRTIDPNVTGTPVQLYEYTTLLKNSYQEAAWYSLVAIIILVFIHFRSIICIILSLLPVGVGMLWMVGCMGWCNVPFNPANIMTLPLAIGIGITSGIHILNRFAEEQNPAILAKSTGKAVIVSALTTVAGFGSLMLAKHQGIQSLGFVMSIGTTTCMIAALTLLPAVIILLMRKGWRIHKPGE